MKRVTEVRQRPTGEYFLRERLVNPRYVVDVLPNMTHRQKLMEGKLPDGLMEGHEFVNMIIDNGQGTDAIVVVGSLMEMERQFGDASKKKRLMLG